MPIKGKSLGDCVDQLRSHLNRLLACTVTPTPLVVFSVPPRMHLTFRQAGQPTAVELHTKFGRMGLFLGQICESRLSEDQKHTLMTVAYTYSLRPLSASEPLFRWEYVRQPRADARWCRHHLQGPILLDFGEQQALLNDFHVPTGWVTIEEVLRFCIVDLGVRPLHDDWHDELMQSYQLFKTEFSVLGEA